MTQDARYDKLREINVHSLSEDERKDARQVRDDRISRIDQWAVMTSPPQQWSI